MTKSITIAYQEADETLLMGIFKKFKVKTLKTAPYVPQDDDDQGVPLRVALEMVESLNWIKKVERGEAEPISWEQMMSELEADKVQGGAVAA
jgi:hypothetical protein